MEKTMWKGVAGLILAGTFVCPAVCAAAQTSTPSSMAKDDLFAGAEKFAKGATDITELTMDPESLNMVGGKNATRAHHMVLNVVRTYTYDKPGMYNIADVEEIRNRLNTGDWHCSVHTRDLKHGESTDICNKHRTDNMTETAIITVEPKELTFIHTIRQGGDGWSGGMGELGDFPMGPAFNAQMAILQAQMKAQMATLGPQMKAQMAGLRPQIDAQVAAQLRALEPDLRGLSTGKDFDWDSSSPTHSKEAKPVQPVTPPAK